MVEGCLRLLGHYELSPRKPADAHRAGEKFGRLSTAGPEFPQQVAEMLQMIASTKEYLYA